MRIEGWKSKKRNFASGKGEQMEENSMKKARLAAGLTIAQAASKWQFPVKTWEAWEAGDKKPPVYIEKLLLSELEKLGKNQ